MIVVSIDIHRYGMPAVLPRDRIGKIIIWNDGTGNHEIGNYEARVVIGSAPDHPYEIDESMVIANGRVEGYRRSGTQSHIANLLREVLNAIGAVQLPDIEQ